MPRRVQLSRAKGWRKPEGAVVVARPTKWGNPYKVDPTDPDSRARVIAAYRRDLLEGRLRFDVDDVRRDLVGRDLACWCAPDLVCHADVLLEVANHPGQRRERGTACAPLRPNQPAAANVFTRSTANSARVTGAPGAYRPGATPTVTPSAASPTISSNA